MVAALLLTLDVSRAPEKQLSAKILLGLIDSYQATLSPLMPSAGVHCRFTPTCSHYAEGAIQKHGALVGTGKTCWRLLRCAPWTPKGTVDPP